MNGVQYTQTMMSERNPQRHDRDSVADTALQLLEEVGLPDLSMRRLAGALGVQPSALYWHFENKQALLGAVADRILSRIPDDAQASASDTARSIRDALLAYRDGAEVVMSTHALGLGTGRARELLLRATSSADAADVMLQFILGHTLLLQQRMHAESHGAAGDVDATALATTFDAGIRMLAASAPVTPRSTRGGAVRIPD